jgi:hypothetical protein
MRKPSAASILAVLLALSWIGFLTKDPHAQEAVLHVPQSWEYKAVKSQAVGGDDFILTGEAKVGWELVHVEHHRKQTEIVYYYLRRPTQ